MIKIAVLIAILGVVAADYKKYSLASAKCRGKVWNGCCTKAHPCGEGDGDCDNDAECGPGLKCGVNNCPWFGKYVDCCYKPALRCKGKTWNGCCTAKTPCGLGDGDCDSNAECVKGLVCGTNNCPNMPLGKLTDCCTTVKRCKGKVWNGCCTKATPCKEGDGDCDNNSECAAGLKCGVNNCPWFGAGKDCCVKA